MQNISRRIKDLHLPSLFFFLAALGVFSIQLVYNPGSLPLGFELGKVFMVQMFAIIFFVAMFSFFLQRLFEALSGNASNRTKLIISWWSNRVAAWGYPVLVLSCLLTVAYSPYLELSIFGSQFRMAGIYTQVALIIISVFAYFGYKYINRKLLMLAILFPLIWQAMIGYLDATSLTWELIQTGYYVNGNFGQANFFAGSMNLGLALTLFILVTRKKHTKYSLIGLISLVVLFLGAIYLSFSTGGLIFAGFLVAIAVFAKLPLSHVVKKFVLVALIPLFLAAASWGVIANEPGRSSIWQATAQVIPSHALFGFGTDSLGEEIQKEGLLPGRYVDRAHNIYLDVIYTNGFFQLAIWLALAAYITYKLWKSKAEQKKEAMPLLIILLVFLLSGVFHEKSIYHSAEFMFTLGCLLSVLSWSPANSLRRKDKSAV